MADNTDLNKIEAFLDTLKQDLDFIVQRRREFFPGYEQTVDADYYESLRDAWEGSHYDTGVEEIFEDLISNIGTEIEEEGLQEHGLGGAQLRFKLDTVSEFQDGFAVIKEHWEAVTAGIQGLADPIRLKVIGPITASYLDTAETILDSVLDVVGGKEAIREFKEMLRGLLPF